MLLRSLSDGVGIRLDETTTLADLEVLLQTASPDFEFEVWKSAQKIEAETDPIQTRNSPFLTHPVFSAHHSETQMVRYIRSLEAKDLTLVHSMIPLGSCTMKLNATSEMVSVSWPQFAQMHPFAPAEHVEGYAILSAQLRKWIAEITGFHGMFWSSRFSSMSWNFAWMNTTWSMTSNTSFGSTWMPSRNAGRWPGSSPGLSGIGRSWKIPV